ncbi:hypothetical protein ABPG75_001916 [Micractinium tetrahymenae]
MIRDHGRGKAALLLACMLLATRGRAASAGTDPPHASGAATPGLEGTLLAALRRRSTGPHPSTHGPGSLPSASARRLLDNDTSSAVVNDPFGAVDGYFDAAPVIPSNQLGWLLKVPAGGWEEWAPPASDGSAVGVAVTDGNTTQEADAVAISKLRALLVAAQLDDAALSAARLTQAVPPPPGKVSAALDPTAGIPLSLPSLLSASTRRLLASDSQAAAAGQATVSAATAVKRSRTMAGLPGLSAWKRSFSRNVFMPRPHSSAFPPWGLPRAPLRPRLGCLGSGNVKRRGVSLKGNGIANEAPALAKADRAKGVRFHYFPPGTYRIRSSLTLIKPVVMGTRTRFLIDRGATLTLLAPPRRAPLWGDPMFTGQGLARMGPAVKEVLPAWWSSSALGDAQIMQAAVRSCAAACTVLLSRPLFPRGAINLAPNAGVFSTAKALIYGQDSPKGEGLVLQPGAYKAPLVFTGIRSFRSFGLKVLPGVRNANIQVAHLSMNNDAIVFEGGSTLTSNVYVSHVSVAQMNQNMVVFSSGRQPGRFNGITVRANFVVSGGQMDGMEGRLSSCTLVRGRPPLLSQAQVVVQAIDSAQFVKPSRFVPVRSTASGPVATLGFRSDSWNGGYRAPGGTQVDGAFVHSAFLFKFADSVGHAYVLRAGSSANALRNGDVGEVTAASHFYELNGRPGNLRQFFSANPSANGSPINSPGFYVTFNTQQDWPPGKQRTLYFHTQFAQPGAASRQMDCIPYREFNPGVLCVRLVPAPTSSTPNRMAVSLMNLSRKVIKAGYRHRFGVQVSP